MTHLSVNDHLEGILSDFEALKRSFDMEDIDDTPVFSPTSTHSSAFSPNPNNVTRASNGDSQLSAGSHQPLYQSRIRISSGCSPSQSPVLKSRITSSLSFNRGTMQMDKTNGSAGQGLTRVSSFQTRLHPSGFSSSGHGSDSESLHSSTSSLECPPPTKPFQPIRPTQNSVGQHGSGITISNVTSPVLKKFSSHGNVFHSEIERPGVRLVPVTTKNHGSLPSLDLHIAEDNVPDLVPSPDAGYPPSEGWSSPTPDYKRPSSRNAKSISREPSFSSSSSSSSPPTDCAPINCDMAPSPSPPPIFGPLQQTILQKFPLSLQSPFGKPNGSIPEQFNRPLPRTQLRVNLNSTPGVSPQGSKEKTDVTLKSQPQIASIGRSNSLNYNAPPISGSRLPPSIHQDSLQESNFNHNMKPSEFHSSSERLRSLMQRANSFTKADNVQNQYVRDVSANEKSTGHLADPLKTVKEPSFYQKSSLSTRIQGNGHSASMAYLQGNQQSQRFPDAVLDSRNGVPSIKNCLQSEPQNMEPLTVTPFKQSEGPLRLSEDFEEENFKVTDSGLEGQVSLCVRVVYVQVSLYVRVMYVQVSLYVRVVCVQVSLCVRVVYVQVSLCVRVVYVQVSLCVRVVCVQVSLCVRVVYVQVSLCVRVVYVQISLDVYEEKCLHFLFLIFILFFSDSSLFSKDLGNFQTYILHLYQRISFFCWFQFPVMLVCSVSCLLIRPLAGNK
ncbi:PREDICTED: uncharacterized protein LOC108788730 [Nanorana parkeri]|uniref:uncharacterized protein LOC108788730 n=1 Tax=Nanorana parkeri TaxID=125878 RepID=UPI0008549EAA|nr:PREDICTED: uncharacterized protein LOC108788730 [Nanorana parkeri]